MSYQAYTEYLYATASPDKGVRVKQEELEKLSGYVAQMPLISLLGTGYSIGDISDSNVTFVLSQKQPHSPKAKAGAGEAQPAEYRKITLNWNKPMSLTIAFTAFDLKMGLPVSAPKKLREAQAQEIDEEDTNGWETIESKVLAQPANVTTKDLEAATADEAYDAIVKSGTKLYKKMKKLKDTISYQFTREDIIIFAKPEILDNIAKKGLTGDRTRETLQEGRFTIAKLGGYKVYENLYLDKADVIVATDITAPYANKQLAANITTLDPSNDIAMYHEYSNIFGIVQEEMLAFKAK